MHRALEIPELVLEFMRHLKPGDVLHFGMTCKVIWWSAPEILWAKTTGPILRSLLPKKLHVRSHKAVQNKLVYSRSVPRKEWTPLLRYASHVRSLSISDDLGNSSCHFVHNMIALLSKFRGLEVLFPKLETVSLSLLRTRSISPLRDVFKFCHMKALVIEIACRTAMNYWDGAEMIIPWQFVELLKPAPSLPSLQSLSIAIVNSTSSRFNWGADDRPLDIPCVNLDILAFITQLTGLKNLNIDVRIDSVRTLSVVAQLPTLETLRMRTGRPPGPSVLPLANVSYLTFTSLRALSMYEFHETDIFVLHILQNITSPNLEEYSLVCRHKAVADSVTRHISSRWSISLKRFSMTLQSAPMEHDAVDENFQSLYSCRNLRSLILHSWPSVYFTNTDADGITNAFPYLEVLSSTKSSSGMQGINSLLDSGFATSGATERALLSVAARCPNLRYLKLRLNLLRIEHTNLDEVSPSYALKVFDASDSLLSISLQHASEVLQSIFPRLQALTTPTSVVYLDTSASDLANIDVYEEGCFRLSSW